MFLRSVFPVAACLFLLSGCFIGTQPPAPLSRYGNTPGEGSVGVHNVIAGDTLYTIAQRYRLPIQDIVALNGIRSPFVLNPGQRIRLPPPNEYKVRSGDTLYDVSRLFGVSSSETARMNNLRSPYKLMAGEALRLPSRHPEEGIEDRGRPVTFVKNEPVRAVAMPQTVRTAAVQGYVPQKVALTNPPPRSGGRFMTPVQGRLISGYGAKADGLHNDGVNIAAPRGTPVRAAENGVVVYSGHELDGYGNLVLVRHADRWMTAYAHMDKTLISKGDRVRRGQTIGTVGSTGSVDTPQLHFEVRRGAEALNPQVYMD